MFNKNRKKGNVLNCCHSGRRSAGDWQRISVFSIDEGTEEEGINNMFYNIQFDFLNNCGDFLLANWEMAQMGSYFPGLFKCLSRILIPDYPISCWIVPLCLLAGGLRQPRLYGFDLVHLIHPCHLLYNNSLELVGRVQFRMHIRIVEHMEFF